MSEQKIKWVAAYLVVRGAERKILEFDPQLQYGNTFTYDGSTHRVVDVHVEVEPPKPEDCCQGGLIRRVIYYLV